MRLTFSLLPFWLPISVYFRVREGVERHSQTEIVNGKLPVSLDGVSVTIDGKAAAVYFVSPTQINVQAPAVDSTGPVQVVVSNANGASDPMTATVQTLLPGFFLFPRNYIAATRPDGSFVAPAGVIEGVATRPARPGEMIVLYGTGFGPTNPAVAAGEAFQGAAPLTNQPSIRMGSTFASVSFAGLSAAGLNQFNVVVPNVGDGDYDVLGSVAGVRTQSLARLRVQQ